MSVMAKQRKRHCDNKSGIKGVIKSSKTTWRAQISLNGKTISLGSYPYQSQAADVYWEAAKLHFGESATLSSPKWQRATQGETTPSSS